jgi:acyl-coenzyme A thioesterase PaaI-like protein
MPATTNPTQPRLKQTRATAHPRCVVCNSSPETGFGLDYVWSENGGIEAVFDCPERYEGYPGLLHGGVISSLLDGAMTNCLFAHGVVALTAKLNVRFRHPVALATPLVVRARLTRSQPPLHFVESLVEQDGKVKAQALGTFMERPVL